MESAIPLLQQHGENIVVNEEACKHLASIKENLVIIACTGMYRTGKSFLLNSLAQVEKPVFNVGNTTDACTKGIWIYDTKKLLENGGRLIYFDSEGLASLDQDENYDAKIFSLSLLLSSYFILNTMGVIDEGAIDRLFLVSELSKRILIEKDQVENENSKVKDGKDKKDTDDNSIKLARHFPRILFCLRDFVLSLEHNGKPITPDVYLENALESRTGKGRRVDERNETRAAIRNLFRDRDCYTLIRPCNDENKMRQGLDLSSDLRPDFIQQLDTLRSRVLDAAPLKRVDGTNINGAMLVSLTKAYVNAMNANVLPEIKSAWNQCLQEVCINAYEEAFSWFKSILKDELDISNVASVQYYYQQITQHKNAVLNQFNVSVSSASGKSQVTTYRKKLVESVDEYTDNFLKSLIFNSKEQCQSLAAKVWKDAIPQNVHTQSKGDTADKSKENVVEYDVILSNYVTFLSNYDSEATLLCRDIVLIEFLKKMVLEDVGNKFEKNNYINTLNINTLNAAIRRKENDISNLNTSLEREIKRGKEQQETTKKAVGVLERRLLNAEEQKKTVNALLKEEVRKREEALSLRRDSQRLLSEEKTKSKGLEDSIRSFKNEIDNLQMKFVHYKREVDSLVKAKEDEHITSLILNDIVEQVVLIQVAEKSNATLQKVKDELSRSMDERSAMAIKLQDLMVKISSLPEIYQRVLFRSGDGEGVGDFYDQVADEDGTSMFSSWFS